jgi:hypothetical protein
MPYRLSWYQENHVINAAISGNFTVPEFEAYGEELIENYLDSAIHPIHIISDVSQMERFPTQVWTAIHATEPWLRHRNLGWIMLLSPGGNAMLRFLVSAVNQVVGIRYHVVETHEEAYMLLQQLDKTLPDQATISYSASGD